MKAINHPVLLRRVLQVVLGLLLLGVMSNGRAGGQDVKPPAPMFHIAFSGSLFTDINMNDAKAALKAWFVTVAQERGMHTDPEPVIVDDLPTMAGMLRSNLLDGVEMTAAEYVTLRREARFDPLFVASSAGHITEEYVVLVRSDSKIGALGDVPGRHLNVYSQYRACLAQPWLDTLLVQKGLPPAAQFFHQITLNNKLTQVILPVFFHQSDACLVTRSGFELMCELNPQIGRQLKIIATSPEIVPAVFCFLADVPAEIKEPYVASMRELHLHVAGQQVLTIFHREKLEEQPAACLQSALDLMQTYARVCGTNHLQVAAGQSAPEGAVK